MSVYGHVECMEALSKAGCDKEARDGQHGLTGLMAAARNGHLAVVQAILGEGGSDLDAKDDDDATAFLWACSHGRVECVEALSKAGCDKEARNEQGHTGLRLANAQGHSAVVDWICSEQRECKAVALLKEAEGDATSGKFQEAKALLARALKLDPDLILQL